MLLRFSAQNHRSIKHAQEISWLAATQLRDELPHAVTGRLVREPSVGILPVLVLYGANAAGKSNMLDALVTFAMGVEDADGDWAGEKPIMYEPFELDEESRLQPTTFEADVEIEGVRHTYGYSFNDAGVVREWLYSYPKNARKILFQRDFLSKSPAYFGPSLKEVGKMLKQMGESSNFLFLARARRLDHPQLTPIAKFFNDLLGRVRMKEAAEESIAKRLYGFPGKERLLKFIKNIDAGILDYEVEQTDTSVSRLEMFSKMSAFMRETFQVDLPAEMRQEKEHRLYFTHKGADGTTYKLRYGVESSGTKQLINLLVPMTATLVLGGVLVIDEIATNLHTKLGEKIIQHFTDPKLNPNHAQLVFSTHDTNLLAGNLLRRDEVWFSEKNEGGETCVYPLTDFSARRKENIEKGYLEGRYGAIPFFGRDLTLVKS
ncbi:ATP-binding protein [bacterium M00.F.Ca.ET.228.01.1.1]|nr:ATP-binding protein [bacterium M00.F.Ca.ET.228.01.1.1]TGR99030.1 ATP-binding protein [bacterium M00.F.Ca.ET.191.01.1.1]TGU03342.1 ATP-binding protein [bacterium M00.F.Ca.ET.155.01.1.1]